MKIYLKKLKKFYKKGLILKKTKNIILALASVFILAGCSGSDSSDFIMVDDDTIYDTIYDMNDTYVPNYSNCLYDEVDNDFITEEYCKMHSLNMMNASSAYQQGYTGKGIIVAVLDGGVDEAHINLTGSVLSTQSISYTGTEYDVATSTVSSSVDAVLYDEFQDIYIGSKGSGYATAPTVTISGDGFGATAVAVLSGDSVRYIIMTNKGTGYTTATITIDDTGTGGSGATIAYYKFGGDDTNGHGTEIAGIIAGVKDQARKNDEYDGFSMHGVAYDSKILNVKVSDNIGSYKVDRYDGINYAVLQGAKVINQSFGGYDVNPTNDYSVYRNALDAGVVFVSGAGNDGMSCALIDGSPVGNCLFPASIPFLAGNTDMLTKQGGWIVAGSVDANLSISSWSNRAGATKTNFLVTAGSKVFTTAFGEEQRGYYIGYEEVGKFKEVTGTSFATPSVAGAVALLMEKFPHLNGNQIAQILFDTATDLGEVGCDDIYGHGLVNIKKAMEWVEP